MPDRAREPERLEDYEYPECAVCGAICDNALASPITYGRGDSIRHLCSRACMDTMHERWAMEAKGDDAQQEARDALELDRTAA